MKNDVERCVGERGGNGTASLVSMTHGPVVLLWFSSLGTLTLSVSMLLGATLTN